MLVSVVLKVSAETRCECIESGATELNLPRQRGMAQHTHVDIEPRRAPRSRRGSSFGGLLD